MYFDKVIINGAGEFLDKDLQKTKITFFNILFSKRTGIIEKLGNVSKSLSYFEEWQLCDLYKH